MKLLQKPSALITLFILSSALIASSCSTTGMQRSENVQSSMQTVSNDTKKLIDQIDAISSTLNELTRSDQQNVKRAFESYSERVSKINKMEKKFTKNLNALKTDGNKYLAEWNDDKNAYDNAEIQQSSNERRESYKNTFQKIVNDSRGLESSLNTFASNVNQIQKYMSNDLTKKGIESLASLSEQTAEEGDSLKRELRILQNSIQDAQSDMSPSGISQN